MIRLNSPARKFKLQRRPARSPSSLLLDIVLCGVEFVLPIRYMYVRSAPRWIGRKCAAYQKTRQRTREKTVHLICMA